MGMLELKIFIVEFLTIDGLTATGEEIVVSEMSLIFAKANSQTGRLQAMGSKSSNSICKTRGSRSQALRSVSR